MPPFHPFNITREKIINFLLDRHAAEIMIQLSTCTIVSRFCLDVDMVLVWADGLMVTTVT